jgi:hypothetical protein
MVRMNQYIKTWDEIRRLLRDAQQHLPKGNTATQYRHVPDGMLRGTLQEFEEFLEHDEFELAWDALSDVAKRVGAGNDFWNNLSQAAALMKIPEKEAEAAKMASQS